MVPYFLLLIWSLGLWTFSFTLDFVKFFTQKSIIDMILLTMTYVVKKKVNNNIILLTMTWKPAHKLYCLFIYLFLFINYIRNTLSLRFVIDKSFTLFYLHISLLTLQLFAPLSFLIKEVDVAVTGWRGKSTSPIFFNFNQTQHTQQSLSSPFYLLHHLHHINLEIQKSKSNKINIHHLVHFFITQSEILTFLWKNMNPVIWWKQKWKLLSFFPR